MKADEKQAINFVRFIQAMTILQFHAFCGMLWDEDNACKKKWVLWPGVRGYPGQDEILESFSTDKYPWLVKARRRGGSEMAAFVQLKECVSKPKFETAVITKKLPDAKYFLKRRLLTQMRAAYELEYEPGKRFPWPKFTDNTDTGKIVWDNGSIADALSSDNEESRGRNTNLLIFDEIRSFSKPNAEELWSALTPIVNSQPKNRLICLSSAKFGSWANDMTRAIMDGEVSGIRFLFMPSDTNPLYTPEVRRQEMLLAKSTALYIQENPMDPEDCFKGREGAVFRNFDSEVGGKHVNPVELNWGYTYCIGYDHGKRHPAVLLFFLYNRFTNHLYVFDEVYCRDKDLPEVAFEIREKMNYYSKTHGAPNPLVRIADTACFAETGQKTVAESLRDLTGIVFRKSQKYDKLGSLDRLITRFANSTITIDPRCVQLIKQIEELMWKRQVGESKKEEPMDIEDDGCFVGEIKILMADGSEKEIQDIKENDLIMTHLGIGKSKKSIITGYKKICELHFESGEKIQCTPSHPFYTENGFKNASEIGDYLCLRKLSRTKNSMRINITQTAKVIGDELTEAVNEAAQKCTKTYGHSITDHTIQKYFPSIIKTAIKQIMKSAILSLSQQKNIKKDIKKIKRKLLKNINTNAWHGIAQKSDAQNIENKVRLYGKTIKKTSNQNNVLCAKKNTKSSECFLINQNFAPITANQNIDENLELIISQSIVNDVAESLSKTNILRLFIARKNAQHKKEKLKSIRNIGSSFVYNFTSEHGTYYANGYLVSNCDVIRYVDAELAPSIKTKPKTDTLQVILDRKLRVQELGRRGMSTGADALGNIDSWLNL